MTMPTPTTLNVSLVYRDVHLERERAHAKHGAKGNSREDQPWTDAEWLPILTEELGEVAHELTYDAHQHADRAYWLRKELVQVAAMACAWVDSIDRGADRLEDHGNPAKRGNPGHSVDTN
jgi:hypothetical protein